MTTTGEHAMISATQLPDTRVRLLEEIRRPTRNPVVETYAIHCAAGAQALADPRVRDPRAQAHLLARHEAERLANAALYWISPNMTALVLAAAPGMPPFRPTPEDLPAPYGLIYFAAPFAQADENPVADVAMLSDGSVHEIAGGRFAVCAATWGPWDYNGRWTGGGTWFTFYTARHDDIPGPPLRLDNECVVGALHTLPGEDPILREVARPDGTASWMHVVLTAFRLMATSRTASRTPQPLARPFRRRAARAGVVRADEPVQLVDITTRPKPSRPVIPGEGRSYRVRWVVDGHWRNQWYPSSGVHRPRWIEPYVKGPDGAPLRTGETVHLWRDPAEQVIGS